MKVAVLLLVSALAVASLAPGPALGLKHSRKRRGVPVLWHHIKHLPKDEIAASLKSIFNPKSKNGLDDRLVEIMNKMMTDQSMDPLHIPACPFEYREVAAKVNGSLHSVTVTGLSALKIGKLHVNVLFLQLMFNMSLPLLTVHGHYHMDGIIGEVLPIYGNGPFEVNVTDICGAGTLKMGIRNGVLYIKSIDLDLNIGELKVNIENLLEDKDISNVINQMINEMAPSVLADNKKLLEERASLRMVSLLNDHLAVNAMKITDLVANGAERLTTPTAEPQTTPTGEPLVATTTVPPTSADTESPTSSTEAPPTLSSPTTLAGEEQTTGVPTEGIPFEV